MASLLQKASDLAVEGISNGVGMVYDGRPSSSYWEADFDALVAEHGKEFLGLWAQCLAAAVTQGLRLLAEENGTTAEALWRRMAVRIAETGPIGETQ